MKIILRSLIFALAVFSAACKKDNTVEAVANQALTTLNTPASFSWQTSREVSLSIGIAAFDPGHADATLWLNDADHALYEAKTTGRNRVICSSDSRPRHELLDSV